MDTLALGITTVRDGQSVVLAVSGEVDIANGDQLEYAGLRALQGDPDRLVIDLTAVTFMDSSGLGHLVRVLRAARRDSVQLLVGDPAVTRLFHTTGLTRAFAVHPVTA